VRNSINERMEKGKETNRDRNNVPFSARVFYAEENATLIVPLRRKKDDSESQNNDHNLSWAD
jgi:hypothetical protein